MNLLDTLPNYFTKISETEAQFDIGDYIWADVTVTCDYPVLVTYRFNDDSLTYKEIAQFSTAKVAIKFTKKVAAEMRRCDKQNTVPHMVTFRHMVAESTGILL